MPTATPARRIRVWTRLAALAAIAAIAAAGVAALPTEAGAAKKHKKSASKTFSLPGHSSKTFDVTYPLALKFKGAKYSCKVKVSGAGKKNVKTSKGSALGGTVCRVKAKNSGGKSAKVKVTATTTY
ncbi:MAG: hypothetical protein E6G56_10445 [Actinobacteria bacterium]|nr:MAG: hypothetical protein E6G56_10445 [Actinomycetota bacterium]